LRTLGDMEVGSLVYLRVDGDYTPFRVMHHGKPSDVYDDSYLGGTILCKDYTGGYYRTNMVGDRGVSKVNYADSYMHQVLHEDFLNKLDAAMQQQVMEIRLPYRTDTDGSPYEVATGAQGMAAKVWLPSLSEVTDVMNYAESYGTPYVTEGALLDYWKDATDEKYRNWQCLDHTDDHMGWGTRTPSIYHGTSNMAPYFFRINVYGIGYCIIDDDIALWPCLVMPDTLRVDGESHLHIAGAVPVKVSGIWEEGSVWSRVGGVWNEADAIAVKVSGVWKE